MLSGVDGDVFGRVTKLGRAAADAVARALAGESWDAFHASRCIDALLAAALDLILRSAVERSILRGDFVLRSILERFCGQLLDRAVLTGRGGYIEDHGHASLDEARAILAPVASAAAAILEARPTAKRVGLARPHADLGPDTDLLGGP